jgi:3-dehydroquinate synthase II
MKELWLKLDEFKKEYVTTALECGFDAIYTNDANIKKIKELGLIKVISETGDLIKDKDVYYKKINNKKDEDDAVKIGRTAKVIVKTSDWNVIPLENLISQSENIYVEIENIEEAKLAIEILEHGVKGILLNPKDFKTIIEVAKIIKKSSNKIDLIEFEIKKIEQLPLADRVCVDTCNNMVQGEGMLVGNSSSGLFLVNSESIDNPYVNARPFRVNAGAVHSYILLPDDKTSYLSELKSGVSCLIVNSKGESRIGVVGRVKVEKRPMLLIKAEYNKKEYTVILQNAETIRLVNNKNEVISVVQLKKGDKVLGYVEEAGRHFGVQISESIVEK